MNEMWVRNRTTKTNGVSYIIQKGGAAVFQKKVRNKFMKIYRFIRKMQKY